MSTERKRSADSFETFFGTPTTAVSTQDENKLNTIQPTQGIAALIKSHPSIHHRQTPSERESNLFFPLHNMTFFSFKQI